VTLLNIVVTTILRDTKRKYAKAYNIRLTKYVWFSIDPLIIEQFLGIVRNPYTHPPCKGYESQANSGQRLSINLA